MNHFFASNPGLKSRFNTFIEFPDYSSGELYEMLIKLCNENDYILKEDASQLIRESLEDQVNAKSDNFANGRLVRNLYECLIMNHARRVANISNLDKNTLSSIISEDFTCIAKK